MAAGVVGLLMILGLQLALSVRRESQTWDEGNHIFAGYMSWTHADFGLNPEHPPMLKLLATAPLLSLPLKAPELQDRYFKEEAFLGGKDFLYQNDADMILFRTRMAAATLTLLLALLVFLATKEMFGTGAAFIALALLAFEPNLLAHGALVTTDAAFSCFMFATIYAFYRYVKAPSVWRMVIVGVSAGLTLAVKHTGILVFPMLFLLAICEVVRYRIAARRITEAAKGSSKQTLKLGRFAGCHHPHRGGGVVVVLWIPLSGAPERIATESASGGVCAGIETSRGLDRFHDGAMACVARVISLRIGGCAINR